MSTQTANFITNNFPLLMCGLAILFALMIPANFNRRFFSCMLFFVIGIGGIWDFTQHNPLLQQFTPHATNWQSNPLELPFAVANLALGISGVIASFANWSYRAAIVSISTVWLWGSAAFQIEQMIYTHSFSLPNHSSILLTNLLIPLILIILLIISYEKKDTNTIYY